jgi:hypothetical protein
VTAVCIVGGAHARRGSRISRLGYARQVIVVGVVTPSPPGAPAMLAIARRCAGAGARTEIVGALPPDHAGDRMLIELAAAGVGHAALQRTGAEPEAADVDLALRYLPDVRAVVLVRPPRLLLESAAAAASWSGAALVLVDASPGPDDLPVEPLVLAPPDRDPDETFAGFVSALAVRLDAGVDARRAWDETVGALAADRVEGAGIEATAGG